MIRAILAVLGVPISLCAIAIATLADAPVVATITLAEGGTIEVAADADRKLAV